MNLTFAAQLNKMITAGLGGAVEAPETCVAVGRRVEYTSIGPAPILTFEANSELPLKALSVKMEPIQEGSGDPSPENIRAISGRQSVTVTRTGVNVWDEEVAFGEVSASDGKIYPNSNILYTKNYISVKPDTKYYVQIRGNWGSGTNVRTRFYDVDKNYVGYNQKNGNAVAKNQVFTTPDNAWYMLISFPSDYGTTYNHDISINYPSTDHDYHPGTVASVEVQLDQTVYGGSLNVTSGVLTVDRAIVDMGTIDWSYVQVTDHERFITTGIQATVKRPTANSIAANVVSSQYKTLSINETVNQNNSIGVYTDGYLLVRDTNYTDAATFKTAMSGVQLCYELAQPITITLTPEQLTTVLGQNNVWSDADEVSLTYGNIYYTEGY